MNKVKELSFEGETIYCGLDVHKTNWKVNARMNNIEIAAFSQDPNPEQLKTHFKKNYPGAFLKVAYEAGFCGFGIQRSLTKMGIKCIVVNAADIPASDKDRKRKDDKRDARKLSLELAKGDLSAIYVPDKEIENVRALVRQRHRFVQDQTRTANRIKQFLLNHSLSTEDKSERWSLKFIKKLEELDCESESLKITLKYLVEQYSRTRDSIKNVTLAIRNFSKQEPFVQVQTVLQSINGIGLISGMVVQTEIMDIYRFKTLDKLCDYAGLVPDIYSTNDKTLICGITARANEFLRETLIESSWILIRKDPAMLMKFNEYRRRMNENKAIIRISKHLLSRIRHLWINGGSYEKGLV